jgi:hypothetical protein
MHRNGDVSARGLCERRAANFPDWKDFAMFRRDNPIHAPILFAVILLNLAFSGFLTVYWLKDNQWSLGPDELNIQWLSDSDYRAIQTSTASEYKLASGSTLVLPGDPGERLRMLSFYQVGTPDGLWHGRASARLETYTTRTWLGVAATVAGICVAGLYFTIPRAKKPSRTKRESEEFATI